MVAQHVPDLLVAPALFEDLDRLELQALGIAVDRIDDAAASRRVRADVEMVRRRDRKADQLAASNAGTQNATSGPCVAPA